MGKTIFYLAALVFAGFVGLSVGNDLIAMFVTSKPKATA